MGPVLRAPVCLSPFQPIDKLGESHHRIQKRLVHHFDKVNAQKAEDRRDDTDPRQQKDSDIQPLPKPQVRPAVRIALEKEDDPCPRPSAFGL